MSDETELESGRDAVAAANVWYEGKLSRTVREAEKRFGLRRNQLRNWRSKRAKMEKAGGGSLPEGVKEWRLEAVSMRGNARRVFDEGELEGLAVSIRDSGGPLQWPMGYETEDGEGCVLLFGERRLRAMELLRDRGEGPGSILVRMVPEPTEAEFRKWSLVENVQRVSLRPSESARWMREMLDLRDGESGLPLWSVRSLAEEMGVRVSRVSESLAALDAPGEVLAALDDGEVSLEVAGLVGSLPEGLRARAAEEMVFAPGGAMTGKEARRHVAESFRRDLRRADFDREAAGIAGRPACVDCQWCGANREDVGGRAAVHVCLDPSCYGEKQRAARPLGGNDECGMTNDDADGLCGGSRGDAETQRPVDCGESGGDGGTLDAAVIGSDGSPVEVVEGSEGERFFDAFSGRVDPVCGMVDLDARPDAFYLVDGERGAGSAPKWREALEGNVPRVTVAWDSEDVRHELVEAGPALKGALEGRFGSLFRAEAGAKLLSKEEKAAHAARRAAVEKEGRAVALEGAMDLVGAMSDAVADAGALALLAEAAAERGCKPDDLAFVGAALTGGEVRPRSGGEFSELLGSRDWSVGEMLAAVLLVLEVRGLRYEGFSAWCEDGSPAGALAREAEFDPPGWRKRWKLRRAAAERAARGRD